MDACHWLITIVLAFTIALKRKKTLFGKSTWVWTALVLLCCTPIPIVLADQVIHPTPETSRSSSFVKYENGKVYKEEYWYYTSDYKQKYADMFFVADSLDEATNGDKAFKKDSTWIFLSKNGDTLKIEKYKDGQLLSAKAKRRAQ
jgi:hypothetical protein